MTSAPGPTKNDRPGAKKAKNAPGPTTSVGPGALFTARTVYSDRKQREYFSTGFSADEKEFDASKQGGRFHQGRDVRPFYVKRKEDDGSIKVYSNKDANVVLTNMENRASDILKGYNEKHINWGHDQFRSDFINAPKRELFLSFAQATIQQEYTDR